MYPSILDMNENESSKYLRMLELDAYANMLAALRAQGPPTSEKLKLLKDVGNALRIPQERCKAEIRRVILDERLNTIAYFSCGQVETSDEWIKEAIADEVADNASANNEQLSHPTQSERKRGSTSSQAQSNNVPESSRAQVFRTGDGFKNEDSKKRKLAFGVEHSSLAQLGPSKISKIQQIYRQKVKASTKEEQKIKNKQELEYDYKNIHQPNRILQQYPAKLPLSLSSASPKINILQNISIPPPSKEDESTEHLKSDISNLSAPQNTDTRCPSPQPSCSNENQAPKSQKQTLVNLKPNSNITYKHIASPGPSNEAPKCLKVCTTRKPLTKAIGGQKLIIVSNAQPINSTSILQRTLSIPFVKNVSVKNFDKFKIVATSTSTNTLQLTSIGNVTSGAFTTNSAKHKVVTVKTNSTSKKVIPLAQLQALNAKGSIKMLPLGGKFVTKATTTSPLYIMNSVSGVQAITKSTSSTPVIMTCKPQEPVRKSSDDNSETSEGENLNADVVKVPSDDIQNDLDVEAHLSRYTISQERVVDEHVTMDETFEVVATSEISESSDGCEDNQCDSYMSSDSNNEICEIMNNSVGEDVVIHNSDTENGECTAKTATPHSDYESEQSYAVTSDPVVNVQNSADIETIN
ncbi:BRCA2-interacting transcriptional repressor EMSY isoform X2 [Photinus pyralis]|uniref:BRCA2-interacting transcriptional repressor EMSY isoform X2 n=1 Tax=Photinus pyralis TaxID=7054 RepID=UPI00126729AC|nr:BRCA2-interacting transcriptional repressor EMSY isoform X2 [Photinus pyralis]